MIPLCPSARSSAKEETVTVAGEHAFTLVEILVAMAVASLLMVSLLTILSKSMDVSKSANAAMLSKSSAQAALDLIVTDLDSLVVNRNAGQIFVFTNGSLTNSRFTMLTTSMVDSYSTNNSNSPGLPRVIQYTLQYATNFASSTTRTFGLYRNTVDPTNSFVVIGTNDLGGVTSYTTNLLVPNVVAMSCAMYTNYGSSNWVASAVNSTAIHSTNFPPGLVLEVSLTVLDEPYIQRFGDGSGSGNNSASNLIRQYGRKLVRRAMLPSPM
jgi:prepilin-type N-terminal cleavage/methylation domain-containing protein